MSSRRLAKPPKKVRESTDVFMEHIQKSIDGRVGALHVAMVQPLVRWSKLPWYMRLFTRPRFPELPKED